MFFVEYNYTDIKNKDNKMKLSFNACDHNSYEKLTKYVHICKECSTTKIISKVKPELSSHKSKDKTNIFIKPKEYNFIYEFNIPNFIRQLIKNETENFISYKDSITKKQNQYLSNKLKFNTPSTLNYDNSEISEVNENESDEVEEESDLESCNYKSKYPTKEEDLIPINLYYKYRNDIIKFIKEACKYYNASKRCFYLTMNYLDIFFKNVGIEKINFYQIDLITNVCFILAYKFIETFQIYEIEYHSFNTNLDNERKYIKCKDLIIAEINCLKVLEYNLNQISIYEILEMILSAGIVLENEIDKKSNKLFKIYEKCFNLLDSCIEKNEIILEYPPTEIIFSIIFLVRKDSNLNLNIDKYFHKMYGIEMKSYSKCIKTIASFFYKNDNNIIISQNKDKKEEILNIKDINEGLNLSDDGAAKNKLKMKNFDPSFCQNKNLYNSEDTLLNTNDRYKINCSKKVPILSKKQLEKIEEYNKNKIENIIKLRNFQNVMKNDKKNLLLPINLCSSYDKSLKNNNNNNKIFLKPVNSTSVININNNNNKNQNKRYYLDNCNRNSDIKTNNISSIFNNINSSKNSFLNSNSSFVNLNKIININKQFSSNKNIFIIPKENSLVLGQSLSNDKNNIKKLFYSRELRRRSQSEKNIFNSINSKDNFNSLNKKKIDLCDSNRDISSKSNNKLFNVDNNKKNSLFKKSLKLPLIKNII